MSKSNLPTSLPGGMLVPHMSSRRRHEIMDVVFEMTGGTERLAHEMNRSTEGYWNGIKLWAKGLPKIGATEHSVTEGVEALLEKLDERENAVSALDITPREVDNAS